MTSGFVNERPADKNVDRFFREEDPGNLQPCDPPDGQGGGGVANELPGEELKKDYLDLPEEPA